MQVRQDCKNRGGYSTVYSKEHSILHNYLGRLHQDLCLGGGKSEAEIEREIAENIFDWWISKKSYKQWYFDKFMNRSLFEENGEDNQEV